MPTTRTTWITTTTTISDPDYWAKQREKKIDYILDESKSTEIQDLKDQLSQLKRDNLLGWESYGSELCPGDLIRRENELEKKIKELEDE